MVPILYLSHCGSSIGGGEKQLAYLVENIDRTHYRPLVVCPDDGVFVEHLQRANVPTSGSRSSAVATDEVVDGAVQCREKIGESCQGARRSPRPYLGFVV